jgi:hypothetical protein
MRARGEVHEHPRLTSLAYSTPPVGATLLRADQIASHGAHDG